MSEREQALEKSVSQLCTVIHILKMWADGEIAKPENVDNATSEALHAAELALLSRKEIVMTGLKVGDTVLFEGRQGVVREIEDNGIRTIVWWYGHEDNTSAVDARVLNRITEMGAEPTVGDLGKRHDGMSSSLDERYLRRLLAVRVAMPHAYYDDGEAHGTEHGICIDFMREPVADIDAKLRALNVARAKFRSTQ